MDEPRYHLGSVVHAKGETLEDFDGPLDVILLLLSKNKIEIQDIQISAILEQYLAYLDEMKRMDMEIASEFIAMASYLVYQNADAPVQGGAGGGAERDGQARRIPPEATAAGCISADPEGREAAGRAQ